MTAKKIPLFDVALSESAIREVNATLESGWLTTGPKVLALEQAIAGHCGVKNAAAVNSATVGLVLGLRALGVTAGDEVITTPFTFVATIEAILHCGATPVLGDINPQTLTIDPAEVDRRISRRTKVILPVDIAGYPCDYYTLNRVALVRKLALLSDSAHAFGASYKGKAIPQWTDLSVYSFHSTKNLTCGEGGIVVSKNRKLVEAVRLLSRHAMTKNAFQRRAEGKWEYDIVALGQKGNMSDVHAAIGLGELAHFEANQSKRAQLAGRYAANLKALAEFVEGPVIETGYHHAWHLYIVKLRTDRLKLTRKQFMARLADRGIECGVHYKPVCEMAYYRSLGYSPQHYPHSADCGARVVSLPLFPGLSLAQVDFICEVIADTVTRAARVARRR